MENHFSKFSTKSLTESWDLIQPAQNLTVGTVGTIRLRVRIRVMWG